MVDKKNKKKSPNYLEYTPKRCEKYSWTKDGQNIVTISVENKGMFHFFAQKFFGKPRNSQIHLEEMGSFIWLQIDGKRNILEIGELVKEEFGESAEPLYERLSKYIRQLETLGFVQMVENSSRE